MLAQEPHSFLGFNWPLTAMRTSHILALSELKSVRTAHCMPAQKAEKLSNVVYVRIFHQFLSRGFYKEIQQFVVIILLA
jgi:hypothetical protein